jgi:hypothetical protein
MAVHDPDMIRYERCSYAESADILGDDDPAFGYRSLEHASVISPAKSGPASSQRNGVKTISRKVPGEPTWVMLIQQQPDPVILRCHQAPAGVPKRPAHRPG